MTPRRWIYVLGGIITVLAAALVVVLVVRADDSDNASTTTTTSTSRPTTSAPASTAAPTTAAPTTVPPTPTTASLPPLTNDTLSYANYLFAAWRNNNQQAAAQVASAEAVTQMFSQAYSPQTPYTFGTCNPAAGSVFCQWTAQSGATITMTVRNITGGLPIQVVAVTRS